MPAIQPARLKIQTDQLVEQFDSPADFVAALHELLDFYADRTRRPGRGSPRLARLRAYNVPGQVLRQIEGLLLHKIAAAPEASLLLADALWLEPWLECRLLAVYVLGLVPPVPPDKIIERLTNWGKECGEDRRLDASLAVGLVRLRKEAPERVTRLLDSWLTAPRLPARRLGLRVIPPLVEDKDFANLPGVFSLLGPFLRRSDLVSDIDLLSAISALARRSPRETAYFLKQALAASNQAGMEALFRRVMDAFPAQIQEELRGHLRKRREDLGG